MKEKGFFKSLFDISFDAFITTKIIKFVYVLLMVIIGIMAIWGIVFAFIASTWLGVLTLFILAPIGFLIYIIIVRIWLELVIVIFKIAENTGHLAKQDKSE
jgi:hypothetical protein